MVLPVNFPNVIINMNQHCKIFLTFICIVLFFSLVSPLYVLPILPSPLHLFNFLSMYFRFHVHTLSVWSFLPFLHLLPPSFLRIFLISYFLWCLFPSSFTSPFIFPSHLFSNGYISFHLCSLFPLHYIFFPLFYSIYFPSVYTIFIIFHFSVSCILSSFSPFPLSSLHPGSVCYDFRENTGGVLVLELLIIITTEEGGDTGTREERKEGWGWKEKEDMR